MIVLDTNIISELMRISPDLRVLQWMKGRDPQQLCITAITVQEIEFGLNRLPSGKRKEALEIVWQRAKSTYGSFPYTEEAASETAIALSSGLKNGHPIQIADAQIAGICLSLGATLATRNTKDFAHINGLKLCNPFER
ncbi:type II toxin-antitoxin system VapC family toxin [Corynebacterium sp. H130]|uniref:type II toxin-antitoxin system VapC family toxin n=1 Tax=Corynebacterium sp. H130 TaxID=3133444 RepID=UPI0030967FC6